MKRAEERERKSSSHQYQSHVSVSSLQEAPTWSSGRQQVDRHRFSHLASACDHRGCRSLSTTTHTQSVKFPDASLHTHTHTHTAVQQWWIKTTTTFTRSLKKTHTHQTRSYQRGKSLRSSRLGSQCLLLTESGCWTCFVCPPPGASSAAALKKVRVAVGFLRAWTATRLPSSACAHFLDATETRGCSSVCRSALSSGSLEAAGRRRRRRRRSARELPRKASWEM